MFKYLAGAFALFSAHASATVMDINLGPFVEGGTYTIPVLQHGPKETLFSAYFEVTTQTSYRFTVQGYDHEGHGEMGWQNIYFRSGINLDFDLPLLLANIDFLNWGMGFVNYDPVTFASDEAGIYNLVAVYGNLDALANKTTPTNFTLTTNPVIQIDGFYIDVLENQIAITGGGNVTLHFEAFEPYVPPAPEPSTWAMLVLGFGMAGSAVRRSRQKVVLTS